MVIGPAWQTTHRRTTAAEKSDKKRNKKQTRASKTNWSSRNCVWRRTSF